MKYYVVATALIKKDNKFLILKRKSGIHAKKWCFPGGKSKKGEDIIQTLKREIKEETNLDIKIIKKISEYEYKRPDGKITLGTCFLTISLGNNLILNKEFENFKWISSKDLKNYDFIRGIEEEISKVFN